MDALQDGLQNLIDEIFKWAPQLLGALILIIIGAVFAGALKKLVYKLLVRLKLQSHLQNLEGGKSILKAAPNLSSLLSSVVYWLVFTGFLALGASVVGIPYMSELIADIYSYIPNVLAAIAIFLIGSAIAGGVTTMVDNTMGDTPAGKMIESIAPVIVIGITIFMILDQLGVATTIVTITYAALLGTVSLGTALAFGLGGRGVASSMLEKSYESGQEKFNKANKTVRRNK